MENKKLCPTCRFHLTYSCACVKPKCRHKRPEFPASGVGCPKWEAKPEPIQPS